MTKKRYDKPIESESALREGRYFVGKAIAFANQSYSASLEDAARLSFDDFGISVVDVGAPNTELLATIRKERRRIRHVLADIVDNPTVTKDLERKLNFWLRNDRTSLLQFVNGEMTLRFGVNADHPALSIVDESHIGIAFLFPTNLARFLRACEECGDFFMAEGKRSKAKYCLGPGKCAEEIKKTSNVARVAKYREREWLKQNDPEAFANVEAGKIKLEAAYETSRKRQRRK